jgi:group I intron endonuclease
MIGIYKITNPKGKIYIGQSKNVHRRILAHKNLNSNKCVLVYNSIKKYGVENHTFELIEECKLEELNGRELYWTKYHNALHPYGLVLKAGGELNGTGIMSEITKQKMSKSHIGKKDTEETKQKKSQSAKGRTKTAEWRQNISTSHPTKKPVEQYSLGGAKINEYISINEAARQTGIRVGDISACCNGKQKTAFGYMFKFKNI